MARRGVVWSEWRVASLDNPDEYGGVGRARARFLSVKRAQELGWKVEHRSTVGGELLRNFRVSRVVDGKLEMQEYNTRSDFCKEFQVRDGVGMNVKLCTV